MYQISRGKNEPRLLFDQYIQVKSSIDNGLDLCEYFVSKETRRPMLQAIYLDIY